MSNFYEYESVQSAISHGRQHSGTSIASGGGGAMHPPGLPLYSGSPGARLDMPPPRHIPPPHFSQHPGNKGEIAICQFCCRNDISKLPLQAFKEAIL